MMAHFYDTLTYATNKQNHQRRRAHIRLYHQRSYLYLFLYAKTNLLKIELKSEEAAPPPVAI